MKKVIVGAVVGGIFAAAAAALFLLMVLGLGRTGVLPSITESDISAETNCPELYRQRRSPEENPDQTDIQGLSAPAAGEVGTYSTIHLVHTPSDLVQDLPTLEELEECPGFRFLRKDLR